MTGRQAQRVRPGPSDQHGLEPEQRARADQAPGKDARQDAGARPLGRSDRIVSADPQSGQPDADEQDPRREVLSALDAHDETPPRGLSLSQIYLG